MFGKADSKKRVLCKVKSDYSDIVVTGEGSEVTLWSPHNIRQSVVNMDNPSFPCLEYLKNFSFAFAFCPAPESVLIMGLGGGALSNILSSVFENLKIDIVEIDLAIVEIAEKYFGFTKRDGTEVIIDDAALHIKRKQRVYDIIFIDAYIGNSQPDRLTKREFFSDTGRALSPHGVTAINLMTGDNSLYTMIRERISSVYNHMWLLPCESSGNTIAFASNSDLSAFKIEQQVQLFQEKCPNLKIEDLSEKLYNIK